MYIDTHSHITDSAFNPFKEEQVIASARRARVGVMLQTDVDSRERVAMDIYPGIRRKLNLKILYYGHYKMEQNIA